MNYGILTTRFTTETYLENIKWREKNNYKGCIYNLKNRISDQNLYDKPYFVLEMNNEINKVMGIGVIKNKISKRKNVLIYGAGEAGRQLVIALENSLEFRVIGFLDDNPQLHRQVLLGKQVLKNNMKLFFMGRPGRNKLRGMWLVV